jgi:hypothetical protein
MKQFLLILLIALTGTSCKKGFVGFISTESEDYTSFRQQKVFENRPPKENFDNPILKVSVLDKTIKASPKVPKDSIPRLSKRKRASSEIINQVDPKLEKNDNPKKNKPKAPRNNDKSRDKLFFNLITAFSAIYPFSLIGLPLLLLFTSELKKRGSSLVNDFEKKGAFWGKVSFLLSLIGLGAIAIFLIFSFSGTWPLLICSLALSTGLMGLILKPKKNKFANLGALIGGLPILLGLLLVLILIFSMGE